ncbi:hypothetical protein D3C75_1175530 [compost metagenome]
MRLPLRAFSGGFDQVDGARVGQVLEAIFDRVDASGEGQLINVRLVGEAVGHGRHPPHPRGAHQWRHVIDGDAHVLVIIRWDRRAIAHLEQRRHRLHGTGQ